MRLLLVEDTDDLAESLLKHLRQTGHTVDHAPTLKIAEGLWHSEKEAYEVIILDIELPDGEGTTVLKQVRGSALPVGILVLSALWPRSRCVGQCNRSACQSVTPKISQLWFGD